MTKNSTLFALLGLTVFGIITTLSNHTSAQNMSFVCTVDQDGTPTTYAQANNGSIPVFKWQNKDFPPPWTPMRRCEDVTDRLNNFRSQGIPLKNFQDGTLNQQQVICVGPCNSNGSNLLLTIRPEQNPRQVLEAIVASSQGTSGPVYQSNCPRTPVISENSDGTVIFDLDQHLCLTQAEQMVTPTPDSTPSQGGWGD